MEITLETVIFYFLAAFITVFSLLTVTTTVLYVFSILLTSGEGDKAIKLKRSKFIAGLGTTIAGAIIVLFITLKHKFLATTDLKPIEISFSTIGQQMFSSDKYGYLLPFEAVSLLLLACIVGGLLIARKR